MKKRIKKSIIALAAIAMAGSTSNAAELLAGFYDAGADSSTALTRAANYQATGITAGWLGATRGPSVGSTDGFYGSTDIVAPTTTTNNGAYRANVANTITITNNTGSNVSLEALAFDYHNNGATTTKDYYDILTLRYVSGDLEVTDATIINSVSGLARDTTSVNSSDYNDFFWNLTSLTDYTLADTESAVFSLIATYTDTPLGTPNFAALDNIGFTGTISVVPEPTSALASLLLGAGLLRRRRTA